MLSSRQKVFIILSLLLHAVGFGLVAFLTPGEVDEKAQPLAVGITTQYTDPGKGKGDSPAPAPMKQPGHEKKEEKLHEKKVFKSVVRKTPAKEPEKKEIISQDNNPVNEKTAVMSAISSANTGETDNVSAGGTQKGSGTGDRGTGLDTKGSGNGTEIAHPNYGLNPKPTYPTLAKRHGYEGLVVLNVFVLESGNVGKIEIRKSSGYDVLDNSALDAVRNWVFIPGKRKGHAISSWVVVPIRFDLTNG